MAHETINAGFRIPDLNAASFDGAVQWFTEMANHDLLFHPDDDPADIVVIKTGEPMFSDQEAESARLTLDRLFETLGEDVYFQTKESLSVSSATTAEGSVFSSSNVTSIGASLSAETNLTLPR